MASIVFSSRKYKGTFSLFEILKTALHLGRDGLGATCPLDRNLDEAYIIKKKESTEAINHNEIFGKDE